MDHKKILETAFRDPNNTPITLEPANVNKIIKTHYKADANFVYTKTQLWDMEINKAKNPAKYLRHILRPGSQQQIFNVNRDGNNETFIRVTEQKMWKDPSLYTTVIEQVMLDFESQAAIFIGIPEITAPDGIKLVAGKEQPIFHVEHAAIGSEEEPLNTWRIVHLDKDEDGGLRESFRKLAAIPYLRQFNEHYIREDLGQELERI